MDRDALIYLENLRRIQRVGNTLSREARLAVKSLIDDIVGDLLRIDPTGVTAQRYRMGRINKLLERVKERNREAFDALQKELRRDLGFVGAQQATVASDMVTASLSAAGVPGSIKVLTEGMTPTFFRQILDAQPFQGETMRGWFRSLENNVLGDVRRQIQIGMVQNEGIEQLMTRVLGRQVTVARYRQATRGRRVGGRLAPSVLSRAERNAETIVRTAVNEISNVAHLEVWKANDDIVKGYTYLATLDSRTTPICASLDGRNFGWDDADQKRPPQHPNCRSTTTPWIDWDGMGFDPPPTGERASQGGPVSASTNYEQWLKGQDRATQAQVLGSGRAKLFSDGKITLRDAIRSDGSLIPLDELRNG